MLASVVHCAVTRKSAIPNAIPGEIHLSKICYLARLYRMPATRLARKLAERSEGREGGEWVRSVRELAEHYGIDMSGCAEK